MSERHADALPEAIGVEAQTAGSEPVRPAPAAVAPESGGGTAPGQDTAGPARKPPKELGVMLVSAGIVGFVLPGPGVPALVAGGLILWPEGFGKVDGWLRRRFPAVHRKGMGQMERFLSDLERRYPGSTGAG